MIWDILQFPIPAIDKVHDVELNKVVDQLFQLNEENVLKSPILDISGL